jgi:hypothetical protein
MAQVPSGMAHVLSRMTQVSSEHGSADGLSEHDSESTEDPSGTVSESVEVALEKATQRQRWQARSHYVPPPPPPVPTSEESKSIISPVGDR